MNVVRPVGRYGHSVRIVPGRTCFSGLLLRNPLRMNCPITITMRSRPRGLGSPSKPRMLPLCVIVGNYFCRIIPEDFRTALMSWNPTRKVHISR